MAESIDNARERARRRIIAVALALAVALGAAGCQFHAGTDPSWNPFKPCPHGQVRVKDVTRPAPQQWVCE